MKKSLLLIGLLIASCSNDNPGSDVQRSPRDSSLPVGYWRLSSGSIEGRDKSLDYPGPDFPVDAVVRVEKEFLVVAVKAVGGSPSRDTVLCTTLGKEMPVTFNEHQSRIVYASENTYCKGFEASLASKSEEQFTVEIDPESNDLPDWAFRHWETYTRSTEEEFNRLLKEWPQ